MVDVSNLRTLQLHFDSYSINPGTTALLPQILDLAASNIAQAGGAEVSRVLYRSDHHHHQTAPQETIASTSFLGIWPLIKTVADLQDFLLPHAGSLDGISMSAQVVYFNETEEQCKESRCLSDWIKIHILPHSFPWANCWSTI